MDEDRAAQEKRPFLLLSSHSLLLLGGPQDIKECQVPFQEACVTLQPRVGPLGPTPIPQKAAAEPKSTWVL